MTTPSDTSGRRDHDWSLLDLAPDGMLVVDGAGRIAFAGAQAASMFRTSVDALVGSEVDDLLPEELRGVHRAHRTRYRARPEVRAMGAGLSLRARRADGTEFHAEISLSPVPDSEEGYVVAAVRDISERVAAEDWLRRVLLTLDMSNDGIFIFDAETLAIRYVNQGVERLVGYPKEELLTMTPLHIKTGWTEAEYRAVVQELSAQPDLTIRHESTMMRSDGTEVRAETTLRAGPVGVDGTRWIVASARDITERLAAEAEIRSQQAQLQEAERAVALADDRERIARDLHDTVIQRIFAVGLSLEASMRVANAETRPRIERSIEDLDQTIRELRSAIFSLSTPTPAVGGLRGQIMEAITETIEGAGIESRIQFDGPVESLGDEIAQHLVPVVREGVTNAVKHGAARKVRVAVTVGDEVSVSVADDGVGVRGEVLGGHGLRNLCDRAEQLGGSASLAALEGGGSELRWTVPLAVQASS